MGLVPTVLEPLVSARQYKRFEEEGGMNCIECGSCTYVCPAHPPAYAGLPRRKGLRYGDAQKGGC